MKVTVIQMDVALGNPEINRKRVSELIGSAVSGRGQVVVLPEMWNTGYALDKLDVIADRSGEPSTGLLQSLAREHKVDIIGGSVSSNENSKFFNRALVVNSQGELVHTYNKIHLFRLMKEEQYLHPGNRNKPFDLAGVKWGLIICYDLRFPELTRKLAVDGAEILAVPAEWPKVRLHHWRSLLIARAIENQQYVVAVNRVGSDGKNVFGGHSMVVDPLGEVLYEAGEQEEVFTVDIDIGKVAEVRQAIPVFSDRCPDCY
ncbi:carbon-nitrogen family hydrolase [Metallumcola ferriviriculae]|uniref:Carbon-nitrogen family hydrolase n=1 Tax=Metallumcola ferriviriculae TaxID=3039180 RepID=A0AAU0UKJ4_9FIRM|nr:carbon-nitrogen family hydrolase [Desulfitibacteraceae bacterium MK1]